MKYIFAIIVALAFYVPTLHAFDETIECEDTSCVMGEELRFWGNVGLGAGMMYFSGKYQPLNFFTGMGVLAYGSDFKATSKKEEIFINAVSIYGITNMFVLSWAARDTKVPEYFAGGGFLLGAISYRLWVGRPYKIKKNINFLPVLSSKHTELHLTWRF